MFDPFKNPFGEISPGRRLLEPFFALISPLLLAGCTTTQLFGALNAVVIGNEHTESGPHAYSVEEDQKLLMFRPRSAKEPAPIVIFFFGGRWVFGAKEEYRFAAEAFTARGYVVALPDYRLYPKVRYPSFLQDSAKAVRWVRDHAAEFGGDPDRIFLMGYSAGGYNAAMLCTDPAWLQEVGMERSPIKAFVGLAAPYDIAPFTDAQLQDIFGPPEGWPRTQPVNRLVTPIAPMLMLTGDKDDVVAPRNSPRMEEAVKAVGGIGRSKTYSNIDHYSILVALAKPFRFVAQVLEDCLSFLGQHGGVPVK